MSDYSNQTSETGSGFAEDASIMLPPERKVVFYNDDFTTMEFVVDVLVSIFNKSHSEAEELMQTVHQEGSSVVGGKSTGKRKTDESELNPQPDSV